MENGDVHKINKIAEPSAGVDGGKRAEALRGNVLGRRHSTWSLNITIKPTIPVS